MIAKILPPRLHSAQCQAVSPDGGAKAAHTRGAKPEKTQEGSSTWTNLDLQLVGWRKSFLGHVVSQGSSKILQPCEFWMQLIDLQYKA